MKLTMKQGSASPKPGEGGRRWRICLGPLSLSLCLAAGIAGHSFGFPVLEGHWVALPGEASETYCEKSSTGLLCAEWEVEGGGQGTTCCVHSVAIGTDDFDHCLNYLGISHAPSPGARDDIPN